MARRMEREIERLRRQLETLKLRRALANKPAAPKQIDRTEEILKAEVEENGGQLIHYDEGRLQAVKYRPQSLALENLSYEELEDLLEAHSEELQRLKSEYGRSRSRPVASAEVSEDLSYEEVVRMRVLASNSVGRKRR